MCFKMHLNSGDRGEKSKTTSTLDHRNRTKEVKVQNLCDEMSSASVPPFMGLSFQTSALLISSSLKPSQPHTIESLISEPSLTRGRGHAAEIST